MKCEKCGQFVNRTDELCEHCGAYLNFNANEKEMREDEAIDVNFVVVDNKNDRDKDTYSNDAEDEFQDDDYDDYDDAYDDDDDYEYDDGYEERFNDRETVNNRNYQQNSYMPPPKKRWIAILLCAFLWFIGAHRFYLGLHRSALLMFALAIPLAWVTAGITEIIAISWWIYDLVMLILKRLEDAYGRPVGETNY